MISEEEVFEIINLTLCKFMNSKDGEPMNKHDCELLELNKVLKKSIKDKLKSGHWCRDNGWVYCSECGSEPPNESNYESNFCPNCGAKMN